jgi:flagellar motor switch protein FliM
LLIGLEHEFVFALAEALFGGDGRESTVIEKRQLSNIELRLGKKAFDLFAQALQMHSRLYAKQFSNWTVSRQGSISSPSHREPHSV